MKNNLLWKSRITRLRENPVLLLKTFYYNKVTFNGRKFLKRKKNDVKYFFQEITNFIQYYNVNSMKNGEEYIWPYIRNHIWVATNFIALGKSNRKYITPIMLQNSEISQVTIPLRINLKYLCDAYEIDELEDSQNDFLFFHNTNGTEEITINDKIYHRLVDPLYEVAMNIGQANKIEIVKTKNISPLKWMKYFHKTKLIFMPYQESKELVKSFQYAPNFFILLKKYLPSIVINNDTQLKDIINYEMNIREHYIRLLRKMNPKVIFFYGFHYQAPLISAADELGILTVDIQHGLQVGWNPLYNNYDEVPQEGYQALPDYFAVWGEREYDNILKTFRNNKKHKPIYMGSPWLKKIEDFSIPLSSHLIQTIQDFETVILIIMQNQTKIPQLFLDIINQSSDDILWIIRHHPIGERYQNKDFSKTKNILIDEEIDSVLFNELFKHVTIAISEGSALALEASYFGVQNIITSDMGLENYEYEIKNNIFHYVESTEQFKQALKIINNTNSNKSKKYGFKDVDTNEFLNQLLDFAKHKKQNKIEKKNINIIKRDISQLIQKIDEQLQEKKMQSAIQTFFTIRTELAKNTSTNLLYTQEQALWMKEAKVFRRHISSVFGKNYTYDYMIIGDSLHLPRPLETKMKNYGIEHTTTYMLNHLGINTYTWAQRFLTTQKLLDNWDYIMEDIHNKHLIIHLGLNDSAPRIFLEEQRLALREYDTSLQSKIVSFGQDYRKEIISNQGEHCYVPYYSFKINIETIVQNAKKASVKSLTFVTIIDFPESHEENTPGSRQITEKYNKTLKDTSEKYNFVKLIDLNKIVYTLGFARCMLDDSMHLSHYGHEVLANEIIKKGKR